MSSGRLAEVVRFIAWSDYLCPWCWNVSRRLSLLEREYDGRVEVVWKSYLLRPRERRGRDAEKFRRYTESWRRPAADDDAGPFRVWSSSEPPPSHSVPAHCVAKAAARSGREDFRAMHERLMTAYFSESRDISSFEVLEELWAELGLHPLGFDFARTEEVRASVLAEHAEAGSWGANGVPAIRRIDNDAVIVGAHPLELYRRWIDRSLARGEGLVEAGTSPLA